MNDPSTVPEASGPDLAQPPHTAIAVQPTQPPTIATLAAQSGDIPLHGLNERQLKAVQHLANGQHIQSVRADMKIGSEEWAEWMAQDQFHRDVGPWPGVLRSLRTLQATLGPRVGRETYSRASGLVAQQHVDDALNPLNAPRDRIAAGRVVQEGAKVLGPQGSVHVEIQQSTVELISMMAAAYQDQLGTQAQERASLPVADTEPPPDTV